MRVHTDTTLFTARMYKGARVVDIVQRWVTPKQAQDLEVKYKLAGYRVSIVNT